ncbi:MAG: hypothetical protein A3A94_01155 [Candidatus Portnoybacteria bacterium RIFCSPLOWO2_01_FULL_43_11]|uniref:IPT/TIG domain-containing protein n=3 Tax=Bacteria candidate phyla TaxID=1783234 RepID=A0A1G2FRZ2_9BACT|nr:MAG: hypothetical protein A2713_01710 [candidate division WWE3 bacterium RIFCSPHIGHO2_01_FULL_35_17]OGZ38117.1 MAG: hypothetical protein A3A94_01155 [Candidatus Portnoybacteria bacterium RIFCSPLOWO2_01_FULL_43_11]OGZ40855.1 MAG: hypothetical protein A3I20_02520 [Candidatus Portnoybacteria bacterium RIFCSPLOWO2_02_FULL_40_15]
MRKYLFPPLFLGIFLIGFSFVEAAEVGEQVNFFVDSSYDAYKRNELTAVLRIKSDRAYFYVDNRYLNELNGANREIFEAGLEDLADEFDLVIYPKERAVFGSEWSPGIDNDKRITVLILPLTDSAGGYFNVNDEYPKSLVYNSNQREIVYLNALYIKEPLAKSFLAHEFQHLITFYQKTKLYNLEEDIWLNEARSEYAPTLLGYDDVYSSSNLKKRVESFLDEPSDSLTEWQNKIIDYSSVNLFLQYLVDHFGKDILTKMVLNNQVGIASINRALKDLGYSKTFSDVFADWAIADYLNNCQVNSGKDYCYLNKNLTFQRLHVDPTASYSGFPNLIVSRSSAVKDWTPVWYRFRPLSGVETNKDVLKLEFTGAGAFGDFKVPYIIIDNQGQAQINFISLNNQKGTAYIPQFISKAKSVIMMPFNQYKKNNFIDKEQAINFSFIASTVALTEPVIESILPLSGSTAGGFKITITGQNFSQESKVNFGQTEIKNVNIIGDQIITFIAPPHSPGPIDISIVNPDGQSTALVRAFTYLNSYSYPDGSLLRAKGDYKVYVIKGNYKRWIQTAEIFNAYPHLRWENIIEVEPEALNQYQEAWLIRSANDLRVYEVNADKTKHWLNMTAEEFSISGRKWEMVYIVNDFERDFYRTGVDVMFR